MLEDLITFDDIADFTPYSITYTGATFLRDFGPFKKDDKVETLHIDHTKGYFCEYDINGEQGRKCKFTLMAKLG